MKIIPISHHLQEGMTIYWPNSTTGRDYTIHKIEDKDVILNHPQHAICYSKSSLKYLMSKGYVRIRR